MHQGKTTSQYKALSIIANEKKLQRNNIPGLIYGKFQVPKCARGKNRKGSDTIFCSPISDSTFYSHLLFKIVIWKEPKIKTSPIIGIILVQFLPCDGVPSSVRMASSHYLYHHTNVRNIDYEHGIMVPMEKPLDLCTSSISKYLPTRNNRKRDKQGMINRDLHLSLRDFNQLFYDSSEWLSRSLNSSISQLKNSGNTLDLKIADRTQHLLPTYMCSSSLHNAVHIDPNNSSSSFAIFYQEEKGVGMSYFVFPEICLLIQLKTPVLLSWDSFKTKHCSIAMTNGITSMFGC